MAVHFKFRSAVDYDSIFIGDLFISVANLKDRIIEQKNLGKKTDFDLVITDAQSGEEYDEAFLVPRNTSVIIKRVPATRNASILQVNENNRSSAADEADLDKEKRMSSSLQSHVPLDEDTNGMDEFGLDLYSIPEPFPVQIDLNAKTKLPAKTIADSLRQSQDSALVPRGYGQEYLRGQARGCAYLRSTPPLGYICNRCGHSGHFIQHCPTNGDTAYDMRRVKLPFGIQSTWLKAGENSTRIPSDGNGRILQSDETVSPKEADTFRSVKEALTDPPPELRCSLCQANFDEAVMVPCCHYSFCDKCIREELSTKGKCPQCRSSKLKDDDLLPNIALRQAINRFLDLQDNGADEPDKRHQVPGTSVAGDRTAPAEAGTCVQTAFRRPSESSPPPKVEAVTAEMTVITATGISYDQSAICEVKQASPTLKPLVKHGGSKLNEEIEEEKLADAHPYVMKDVSSSVKVQLKNPVIDDLGGGTVTKLFEPLSCKEVEGVALESEISKGKRKKKRARQIPAAGVAEHVGGVKFRKGDRYCYVCGSPEHLARDCTAMTGPYSFHHGNFPPGGPMPVSGMPPYRSEVFWHGQYIPPPPCPFPIGYGDGMFVSPGPAMHFDVPVMPTGPFPRFVPPLYHRPPVHSHGPFIGNQMPSMLAPMDRPLTREEFLELQERERQRRMMQGNEEKGWIPERSLVSEGVSNSRHEASAQEPMPHSVSVEEHIRSQVHMREPDHESVRNYSIKNDFVRGRNGEFVKRQLTEMLGDNEANWRWSSISKDELSSHDDVKSSKSHPENQSHFRRSPSLRERDASRHHKQASVDNKYDSDLENNVEHCSRRETKRLRESMHVKYGKHSSTQKNDKIRDSRTEIRNKEEGHSTCLKSKRNVHDGSKHGHAKVKEFRAQKNEHHDRTIDLVDCSVDVEVSKRKKHRHSHFKSTIHVDHESGSRVRKKRHSKKHPEATSEMAKESNMDHKFDTLGHCSSHHRHSSKHDSHPLDPSFDDSSENSRWQLDSGLDEYEILYSHIHRSRHKHHYSRNDDEDVY